MAGDWIPAQVTLPTNVRTLRIARVTGRSRHEVVGLMVHFWAWASNETADGNLPGMSIADLCEVVGGDDAFWQAVESAGWMECSSDGITIPEYDRWNSKGAKARLQQRDRQRGHRMNVGSVTLKSQPVTQMSRSDRDVSVTREEKRRVLNPPTPFPGGDASVTVGSEPKSSEPAAPKTDPLFDSGVDVHWPAFQAIANEASPSSRPMKLTATRRAKLSGALSEFPADDVLAGWRWYCLSKSSKAVRARQHGSGVDTFLSDQHVAKYVEAALAERDESTRAPPLQDETRKIIDEVRRRRARIEQREREQREQAERDGASLGEWAAGQAASAADRPPPRVDSPA